MQHFCQIAGHASTATVHYGNEEDDRGILQAKLLSRAHDPAGCHNGRYLGDVRQPLKRLRING